MTAAGENGPEEAFELVTLAGGIYSLRSRGNGQTFHPVIGPAAEARAVHVAGTRLVERANAQPDMPFVLWDVGLGAAANALTAIDALRTESLPRQADILLQSFDHTLAPLDFALAHAEALAYPRGQEALLRVLRDTGRADVALPAARLRWQVSLGDFPALLAGEADLPAPHAVFYDPYSPTANPEMWTLETFALLFRRLRADVPCLLTTYTRSTAVRVTLLLAGFHVGIGGASGEKDETTVATNTPALLDAPLTRRWLEKKVYASTNAAPMRAADGGYTRNPISEEDYAWLQAHPQFS